MSEPVDHLHGTDGARRRVRGRCHEEERTMTEVRGERSALRGINRREFVQTMAVIGTTTLFCRAPRTAHGARLDKIGLQLYSVRDQMKADFEGTLARVAEIGYKE